MGSSCPSNWQKIILWISIGITIVSAIFRPLSEPDEARYGEAAREMLATGDFLLPHNSGVIYPDKPPGVYWLMAICMSVFGVTSFAIRLPALIALLLLLWLVHRLLRKWMWPVETIYLALFFISSNLLLISLGQLATIDMVLSTLVVGALVFIWDWLDSGKYKYAYISGSLLGYAILCKGPIPLILVLVITIFFGATSRKKFIRLFHPALLLPAFGIGFSWFLIAGNELPELWDFWLGRELLERVSSNVHLRHKPWWYFAALSLASFLPWFIWAIRCRKIHQPVEHRKQFIFLMCWFFAPLIIFSIPAGKQPGYIAPALPALGTLLANWCAPALPSRLFKATSILWLTLLAVAVGWHLNPMNLRSSEAIAELIEDAEAQTWEIGQQGGWNYGLSFLLERTDIKALGSTPSTWTFSKDYLKELPETFVANKRMAGSIEFLNSSKPSLLLIHDRELSEFTKTFNKLNEACGNELHHVASGRYLWLISNRELNSN